MEVAIEKRRVEGRHVVQIAVHTADSVEKQGVFELLSQQFNVVKPKKGPHIVDGADSVVPVKKLVEEHFPQTKFVSMTELEILGGLE